MSQTDYVKHLEMAKSRCGEKSKEIASRLAIAAAINRLAMAVERIAANQEDKD